MKKDFFIIALIFLAIAIFLIYFTSSKRLEFSETQVFVADQNGIPISGAKISLYYMCSMGAIVDRVDRSVKEFNGTTNKNGIVKFDSYNWNYKVYNSVDTSRCKKQIYASKDGYCAENNSYTCNGFHYEGQNSLEGKTPRPSDIEISIRLIKPD